MCGSIVNVLLLPAMTTVFFLAATAVRAQDVKWRTLSKEAEVLLRAGKLNDALATEREAAELARRLPWLD